MRRFVRSLFCIFSFLAILRRLIGSVEIPSFRIPTIPDFPLVGIVYSEKHPNTAHGSGSLSQVSETHSPHSIWRALLVFGPEYGARSCADTVYYLVVSIKGGAVDRAGRRIDEISGRLYGYAPCGCALRGVGTSRPVRRFRQRLELPIADPVSYGRGEIRRNNRTRHSDRM